jgi:hypothetical protein
VWRRQVWRRFTAHVPLHRSTTPRSTRRFTSHLYATQRFICPFTRPASHATHRNSTQRATALRSATQRFICPFTAAPQRIVAAPHDASPRSSPQRNGSFAHLPTAARRTRVTARRGAPPLDATQRNDFNPENTHMLFQRSETTDRLVRYLQHHDKGSLLNYAELTAHAGEPITSRSMPISKRHSLSIACSVNWPFSRSQEQRGTGWKRYRAARPTISRALTSLNGP